MRPETLSLVDFRAKFPMKPYDMVTYQGKPMECISYPWPDGDGAKINIREKDDPTTIVSVETVDISDLRVG